MSTSTELAEAIVTAEQIGAAHLVPALRAARSGLLNFVMVPRGSTAPMGKIKRSNRPVLVLIGDDDAVPTGPDGWPQADRLVRWCDAAVVHAAGAEPRHYEAAAGGALAHRRALLVETDTAHEAAWVEFLHARRPCLPCLIVKVREGRPAHPLLSAPVGATIQ